MKRTLLSSAVVAWMSVSTVASFADEVVTRKSDPKPLNGVVTTITKDKISVKDGVGKVTEVPSNDVANIVWGGEPTGLLLGRGTEKNGNYQVALDEYNKALKDPKAKGNILAEVEYVIARSTARMALSSDPSKSDDAIKKLETFTKVRAENYHFYEAIFLLGDLYIAKKDFAGAETHYQKLNTAPWPDYKMAAKNASARASLSNNDLPGALSKYEEVAAMKGDTAPEVFRRNEALNGKATVLIAQQKIDDAVKVIDSVIEAASTDDGAVMADAYNLQGDCLQSQNKTKEAILAYLHVPLLFEKEKAANAKALFNLAQLWGKIDQPERAEQAKTDLQEKYPDSEWAKKLQ